MSKSLKTDDKKSIENEIKGAIQKGPKMPQKYEYLVLSLRESKRQQKILSNKRTKKRSQDSTQKTTEAGDKK